MFIKGMKTIISGREYTFKIDSNMLGACFDADSQTIYIGTKGTKRQIVANVVHEILESILTERYSRYTLDSQDTENGNLLFVFNHKEFCCIVEDLVLALKPFLKI